MKVFDLKLNDNVRINGVDYNYKGVQKVRKPNFGKIEQIVFELSYEDPKMIDQKHFDLSVGSRKLKVENGVIIF